MIRKRKTLGTPELPDLCSFLLGEHDDSHANELTEGELTADAMFAIQAGSDTTSAVLAYAFYHLLSNPTTYAKLQEELDTAFPKPSDELYLSILYSLPYLNAVVKEELRLSTPFGNMPRVVPDEGIVLDGRHIPGVTVVGSPTYAMQVPRNIGHQSQPSSGLRDGFLAGWARGASPRKTHWFLFNVAS
ncbi:hypothetical protein SERLADRAFT_458832 [Serpula lacrymans var. lacrymans S7.9]|uniref:Cytochrome P450 n=1 Tax=Serpula lacrymans var. lacrymans (strain S7.9) TaxID=578457 RepID=F8NKH3_SERL9|nr:uncharacterized protein SERLADRAFT_458832 [Serpula lacrymans var. lacrymans S7.9]EGO28439.1 hypothetical protein SERLADRAFT_458832 [Serpula lacrymans var. lacrymans S7.9]